MVGAPRRWLLLAAVLLAAAIAYQPAMRGPFVLDDWGSIQANYAIRAPGAVRIPSLPELLGPGRPVTEVTFALDWRAVRLDPRPVPPRRPGAPPPGDVSPTGRSWAPAPRRPPPAPGIALVVAGAFALHPIQTESVAYAAQRAEVLASLLYLVALLLLDRAARAWPGWRGAVAWAGGGLAWLVGMGSEDHRHHRPGRLLPRAGGGRAGGRTWTGRAAPQDPPRPPPRRPAPRAVAGAARHSTSGPSTANPAGVRAFEATPLSADSYFLTQLRVQWLYLRLLAWPRGLAFDRSFTASQGLDGAVAAAAAGVVALSAWPSSSGSAPSGPANPGPRSAWRRSGSCSGSWPSRRPRPSCRCSTSRWSTASTSPPSGRSWRWWWPPMRSCSACCPDRAPRPRGPGSRRSPSCALWFGLASRARTWSTAEGIYGEAARRLPAQRPRVHQPRARRWSAAGDRAGAEAAYGRAWTLVAQGRPHGPPGAQPRRAAARRWAPGRGARPAGRRDVARDRGPGPARGPGRGPGQAGPARRGPGEARLAAAGAPGDPAMRNVLGQALTVNGDWPGALGRVPGRGIPRPGEPRLPGLGGISLAVLGRRDEACAAFQRAGARSGGRPLPLDAAGHAAALGCPIPVPR